MEKRAKKVLLILIKEHCAIKLCQKRNKTIKNRTNGKFSSEKRKVLKKVTKNY